MKTDKEACCVVSEYCTHPWNVKKRLSAPRKCYVCGERVCDKCSFLLMDLKYCKRKIRVCVVCAEHDPERFGFKSFDNVWDEFHTKNGGYDAPTGI